MISLLNFAPVLCLVLIISEINAQARASITNESLSKLAASLKMYVDELPKIPKLYGYINDGRYPKSGKLTIGMYKKNWKFHRDLPASSVFAYGTSKKFATVPGPSIEALQHVPLTVRWENHLPRNHILPLDPTIPIAVAKSGVPTVVHLHGGIVEPGSDGSILAWFTAKFNEKGPKWTRSTYTYLNTQHPGNLMYHDHALGLTRVNLLAGLFGPYVIRNPAVEDSFNLPSGEEFDRHLVIFDRSFKFDGSIYMNRTGNNPSIHPQWQPEYFGEANIVNGKIWPYAKVHRKKYRFRIINASNARYYQLSLSNHLPFVVIGSDTSYLNFPVTTTNILLATAELFDVIIDFSQSKADEIELINSAPYPYPNGSPVDSLNSKIMKFIISSENTETQGNSKIPDRLVNYPRAKKSDAVLTRYITLYENISSGGATRLYINGKTFEDPVTEKPNSGSTEVWEVINLTQDDHPLHIHIAKFQAIQMHRIDHLKNFTRCMTAINDAIKCNIAKFATGKRLGIPNYERTWKSIVKIPPGHITTVIVKFNMVDNDEPYPFDATTEPGYVYHCHILDHEDNQMIRPLKLI